MKNTQATVFRLWQKVISLICAVALLAPLAIDYQNTAAQIAATEHRLAVLLVNNTLFEGDPDDETMLTGKIYRYAADLQAALPNTRTLVLPVNAEESPGDIFAALEKLYLEGQRRGQGKFRLSGVVLIGDIPLPIVRSGFQDAVSVFPYTDFESPAFIWQDSTEVFVPNDGSNQMQAEIFHGVIRAPGEVSKTETEWLSQYFDKNHAYHAGERAPADQTLFFADMIGEFKSLHPLLLWMYEAAEGIFASDIAHYRYNRSLYEDAQAVFAAGVQNDIDLSAFPNAEQQIQAGDDVTNDDFPYPDSLTHQYIRQYLPHFVKVASGFFSIADPLVKGSGRWMIDEGNVGTLPVYMSGMDVMSKEFLRELETEVAQSIYDYVDANIQRPVEVLVQVVQDWSYTKNGDRRERLDTYENQLYGRKMKYIDEVEKCTIHRGESPESPRAIGDNRQLVEMNHLWNRFDERMLSGDDQACDPYGGCCFLNSFEPEQCIRNAADQPIWDPIGGKLETRLSQKNFVECMRISNPKIWIASEDYQIIDDMPRTKLEFTTKQIPTTMFHNEPRPETIAAAIEETLSGAIPADENHTISYQGPGGNVIKVILPDLVESDFLKEGDTGSIYNKFRTAYDDFEKQIRIQNLRSNFISYVGYLKSQPFEYHMAPTTEFINPPLPEPEPVDPEAPAGDPAAETPESPNDEAPQPEEEDALIKGESPLAPTAPVSIREGFVTDFWRVEPYQGMPYLEYQVDEVWKQAEDILRNRLGGGDSDDLWIRYIESAPADLRQQIEGLFQNIVDPTTYDNSDLDLDRSDIISYQEFVAQEGGSLTTWIAPPSPQCLNNPLSPYCLEYYPMPHLQRWYPQTITFAVAPDPGSGFVIPFYDQSVSEFGAEPLEEFGQWRRYNADQKHIRALELFFGTGTPDYLNGTSNGFEFSSMRALGNADEIWWGGEERVYIPGDDSDWDATLPTVETEEPEPTPDPEAADEEEAPPEKEEENQCSEDAYMTGVPITEWLPAMQCWLDDTLSKPLTIEMSPQCSYTGVLGESDYDIYSDAWNAGPPQVPNGARISISGSSGNYLLSGESATVTIRFERPDGSLITGGIDFVAEPIGDLEIVGTNSQSGAVDGQYRDTTFSGEFVLPVTVTGDGRAGIQVSADRFGDAQLVFAMIGAGRLQLEPTGGGGEDTKVFRVSVLNENGIKLSGYEGQAVAQVSDTTAAQLLSADIPITDGDGEVVVFHNGDASFILTVTLPGFAPAQFGVSATRESEEGLIGGQGGDTLQLRSPPKAAYAGEEVVLEIAAIDESGRFVSPANTVTLEATTDTAENVSIRSLGDNRFGIVATEKTGSLRLIANAAGYEPLRISLPIVFRINTADIRTINPNTMAMSLLGSNFADFFRSDDPIANAILFTEVPQAVLSSINPISIPEPRLSVFENGSLRLFERGLEANIASYSPLTIRVFDRLHSEQLAEYALSFTGGNAVAAVYDAEQIELGNGIFFRDFGGETALEARQQGADLIIADDGNDILTVNPNISFSILDNRYSLRFETDTDLPVVTLLSNSTPVADFVISGATLAIMDAPGGQTEFFAVPANDNGSKGFSVVSDAESPSLPTGGRFFETADQTFGVGFNLDDNFALQFASGVPLGEAARFGVGPNGILLGDPSVSLGIPLQEVEIEPDPLADEPLDPEEVPTPTPTTDVDPLADDEELPEEPLPQTTWEPKLFAGFDRGIGKEVIRYPDKKIESATAYDYNGDIYPDLLLATGEGKARVLMNLGDLGFRDVGEIVADAEGLHSPVAIDTAEDGYDEIIAIDDTSELKLFHNTEEVIERNTDELTLPTGKFISLKATDFDQDGFDDLLAQDSEGRIVILWGAASGYTDTASTELGNFGTQIEEGDLAENNTLISIPNITERSNNTIPLYIKAPITAADGLTTVDDVLIAEGEEEEEALTDPTFSALLQTEEQFPQSFDESIGQTRRAGLQNIALFATLDDVAGGLHVELTMSDDNDGAVNEGDVISFTLELDNDTDRDLHFALAHVLNPALAIIESSLTVPDSWPEDRPEPRLQTLSQGQLRILGIRLNEGESRTLRFQAEMTEQLEITPLIRNDLAFEAYPADGKPDVTVIIPGLNGQYHYLSGGGRDFSEYFEYASASEAAEILGDMTDTDGDGVPDTFLTDTNGDGRIDVSDQVFDRFKTDTDEDGYPDSWDEMNGVWDDYLNEDWQNALEQFQDIGEEIMSYTACDGGCLDIPINFAFLVPGTFNLFDVLVKKLGGVQDALRGGGGGSDVPGADFGVSPELQQFVSGAQEAVSGLFGGGGGGMLGGLMDKATSFLDDTAGEATDLLKRVQEGLGLPSGPIVGSPVFGIIPSFPFVCSGSKCYELSSTFRMYVSPTLTGGVGVAFCTGVFPASFCKAFAPEKLNIGFICDEPKNDRGIVHESDSGSCSFSNRKQSKAKVSEGGFRGLLQMLESRGSYTIDYDTGVNRRVMPFPWNWLYDQVAEFQAMFSLPAVTVYYPDMSGMSPASFRDRFGDFYDNIDARLGEVTEGVTTVGEESFDAFTELPSKATKIFVPDGGEPLADRDWLAEAKTASREIMDYKSSVESSLSTFDDLYAAVSNLPLVQIEPQVVHIKVPYLSRAQILAIMADLEEWIDDAQVELDRVRENWTSCPAGTPLEECSAEQAIFDHVNTSTNRLIATARTNITVLQEYLNLPEIIGSIDMTIAQWLSQVLCFLDTSIFSLIHWYVLNKQRLEAWISLYFFMQEIISSWEIIKDFFLDYESFCHDCRVDRGGLVLSTFQMFMGIIPTPPIVYFPRLPNLTLDLTQLNGGVTIPVPKPDIRFVPIIFPKVPRLSLPDSPSGNIILPGIPLIPLISAVPPVPPFPEIPIIELPDLPPPPRIPDLPDFIGEFLSLAKPFLYIYCLYKNGIFPHPEMDLKSVIEDLTMRPVLSMTNFDFSGALFEDFQIPSVRELNIALQMNLDMYAADYLVDAMRAAVLPWNTTTTDLRMQAEVMKRDAYSTLQMMQYNIEEIPDQELDLSGALGAMDTGATHPLGDFFARFAESMQSDEAWYDATALRQKYGAKPIRLPEHLPAVEELKTLRGNIARLQEQLIEEHRVLLATRDVTRLKGDFVADSALASAVYGTEISGGLPELSDFSTQVGTPSEGIADFLAELEADATRYAPERVSLQETAGAALNFAMQVDETDIVSSGNDLVQQKGYFGQCTLDGEELSGRILYHQGFAESINTNLMLDLDLDGDEEMVIINTNGVFVKENHSFAHEAFHFTDPPEIGSFDSFVPIQEAVKNIKVTTRADGAKVSFEPRFDTDLLGIEITAREQPSGYDHEDESENAGAVLTALLVPTRFLPEGGSSESYVPNDTFQIGPWLYSGTLFVSEFLNAEVELPLPVDRFWHIRIREIRLDGFSTGSEAVLSAPEAAIDRQAPIIIGDLQSEAVIYEDVDLTVPIFDDGSSVNTNVYSADELDAAGQRIESAGFESPIDLFGPTVDTPDQPIEPRQRNYLPNSLTAEDFGFVPEQSVRIEWDLNDDGIMDAEGEAISFRPKRPGDHQITIRATDRSGNVTEEDVVIEVFVPTIALDREQLANGIVSGEIAPKYAGMPFVIVRERDGRSEIVRTPTANDEGKYFTERFGRFRVDDFDFDGGAALRDEDGTVLASIDRESGRVVFEAEGFSLSASPQGEMRVIEDATGQILFSVRHLTDGNADVRILSEPIDLSGTDLPQGVYVFDVRPDDKIRVGSLPTQAASFAGGALIFHDTHHIAAISSIGEIVMFDADYTLQVKRSERNDEPVVLQIIDQEGQALFELLIRTAGKRLFLTKRAEAPDLPLARAATRASLTDPADAIVDGPFPDVPLSHPAYAAIENLRSKQIVEGFADGTFRPDAKLTRAEFVKMTLAAALCRECTLDEAPEESDAQDTPFFDVATDAWYRFCIELAHSLGIVNGFADQTFRPDISITRAEAAAILLRAADIPLATGIDERILDLPDDAWYFAEILTAVDIGLIPVHFGNVYPEEPITRGEFAQMATKVLETNACEAPGPNDIGVTIDMCPQVPEDVDGIEDTDGCPDFEVRDGFVGTPAGTYITSYTGDDFPYLDFVADLITGDRVSVAIVAEDSDEVYSQSPIYQIPFDFDPQS